MQAVPRTIIVVPTIREASIREFLAAWKEEFRPHRLIIVEDNPEKRFEIAGDNVTHYSWGDIDGDLGADSWVIPRRTDCVRSYGYLKAFQANPEMIITLDDDCYPLGDGRGFVEQHWRRLHTPGKSEGWLSTLDGGLIPRGVPYYATNREWRCVLNHGLWESVPDWDAPTQLTLARRPVEVGWSDRTIPPGRYFPMCGMNIAFRPEIVPALYFLLMGRDYDYDRFGDIWAGVILKRIADHLGSCVNSGSPAIKHMRASNVWANLRKEAPGLEINEKLWLAVDAIRLGASSFRDCYREIAGKLDLEGVYFERLRKAMTVWTGFFPS